MAEQKDVSKTAKQQIHGGGYEVATQDSVDRLTRLLEKFDLRSNGGGNSLSPEVERDIAIVTTAFESIKAALALADNPIAITECKSCRGACGRRSGCDDRRLALHTRRDGPLRRQTRD